MTAIKDSETNLIGLNTTFMTMFEELFSGGTSGPAAVMTELIPVPDSQRLEYAFTAAASYVREWRGAKHLEGLSSWMKQLDLRSWEQTFEVDRKDVDYDRVGTVARTMRQHFTGVSQNATDKILFDELVANTGEGPIGFDGVNLIDTAHPMVDGTTQSNKSTTALSYSNWDAIVQAGSGFVGHDGEPLQVNYDTLIVGPKNTRIAKEIAGGDTRIEAVTSDASFILPGASDNDVTAAAPTINVFKGSINVIEWQRLTGTYDDYYYAVDSKKPYKPLILGVHRNWQPVELTDITDVPRFLNGKYLYGVEADLTPGAGAWPAIYAGIL